LPGKGFAAAMARDRAGERRICPLLWLVGFHPLLELSSSFAARVLAATAYEESPAN
jgi:hypothetical protein